ncbi:MAG: winged helix-turn-helix domain-containing protein [Alphaproteobacteria bacterium]|nr:winged helix-turn-helix domain-containing protein [Alphaproteobacteria bacterium]
MPPFDLISPDNALHHIIREQIAAESGGRGWAGPAIEFMSLAEALEAWKTCQPETVLIDDAAFDHDAEPFASILGASAAPVLLFILGEAEKNFDNAFVTETFSKPVRLGHLLTRWQFYNQARAKNRDVVLTLGPWRFMPRARQLSLAAGSAAIKLTDKEASLLEYLCGAGEPMTRDEILAAVWGYDGTIDTHTLETHIYRLRCKLALPGGAKPEGDAFLVERGRYRINPSWRSP